MYVPSAMHRLHASAYLEVIENTPENRSRVTVPNLSTMKQRVARNVHYQEHMHMHDLALGACNMHEELLEWLTLYTPEWITDHA